MPFTSLAFLILTAVCTIVYYCIPSSYRRVWLLLISCLYYMAGGPLLILYLLFAAVTTYVGGRYASRGYKAAVVIPLVLDFGVLAFLKYTPLVVSLLNSLRIWSIPVPRFVIPLGISFYTFQAVGYLLDVYWKRCEEEKNFGHYLLFVGFFPQLMQGPIGRYAVLSKELAGTNTFSGEAVRRGLIRISYGFFKKMVIADNAALYVNCIFDQYQSLKCLGFQGVLMYSIQLYMDFSGGIDIACGIAEMMGIHLSENFRQPYFAQSLTDFWHRWHITLGTWMKDYLFYPISLSSWMSRFRKTSRKLFGKELGRAVPVGAANLIVFFAVGVWHGPELHFLAYGLYHGLIIAVSGMLTGPFRRMKKRFGITDQSVPFQAFRMARTFVLVNISWFLDRSGSIRQALVMFKDSFSGKLFSLTVISPGNPHYCLTRFIPIAAGCIIVLVISILKERKKDVLKAAASLPSAVLIAGIIAVFLLTAFFGVRDGGGFIYANF